MIFIKKKIQIIKMVFKKFLSTKKKLLYSDLTILNNSKDASIWIEQMRNYFIMIGYKEHFENKNQSTNQNEWKIDEEFMKKIMKDHLKLNYHKYLRSDLSIYEIFKELEYDLVTKPLELLYKKYNPNEYHNYIYYSRFDNEFGFNLNKIYFNFYNQ